MPKPRAAIARAEAALRAHALAKPSATEHFPWGERAIKVKGKVFLFMSNGGEELSLSTKLPDSAEVALLLPFAAPTGYGLGKAGWVSARFAADDAPPVELLCRWIDESYQAVAPKKLAQGAATPPARRAATVRKQLAANKPAAKKPARSR